MSKMHNPPDMNLASIEQTITTKVNKTRWMLLISHQTWDSACQFHG